MSVKPLGVCRLRSPESGSVGSERSQSSDTKQA